MLRSALIKTQSALYFFKVLWFKALYAVPKALWTKALANYAYHIGRNDESSEQDNESLINHCAGPAVSTTEIFQKLIEN